MSRVVVTGGLGFIGTSVVRRFLAMGHEVILVDFLRETIRRYEKYRFPILKEVYHNLRDCLDVREPYELIADLPTADLFVHLGACVDTESQDDELYQKNVDYVRALVYELPYNSKVIFGSSAATYGTDGFPCNPYGATKCIGENLFRGRTSINTIALRFFNVFGRYEHHKGEMASVPFKLAQAYKNRNRFDMFSPDASRDFVSVSDVADAVVGHIGEIGRDKTFKVYDVGRGENVTFGDLDYKFRVLFDSPESRCNQVEMPEKYKGRYQFYTKAGTRAERSPYVDGSKDLRDFLKEQFIDG